MSDMSIYEARSMENDLLEGINNLLPQLSTSAPLLEFNQLRTIIEHEANCFFVARSSSNEIIGMLTLAVFPIPSGVRAWIEDVVVSENARGQGIGGALARAAMDRARELGARTIDLTSRPSRESANRLYQRIGFELRETNVYRVNVS